MIDWDWEKKAFEEIVDYMINKGFEGKQMVEFLKDPFKYSSIQEKVERDERLLKAFLIRIKALDENKTHPEAFIKFVMRVRHLASYEAPLTFCLPFYWGKRNSKDLYVCTIKIMGGYSPVYNKNTLMITVYLRHFSEDADKKIYQKIWEW